MKQKWKSNKNTINSLKKRQIVFNAEERVCRFVSLRLLYCNGWCDDGSCFCCRFFLFFFFCHTKRGVYLFVCNAWHILIVSEFVPVYSLYNCDILYAVLNISIYVFGLPLHTIFLYLSHRSSFFIRSFGSFAAKHILSHLEIFIAWFHNNNNHHMLLMCY